MLFLVRRTACAIAACALSGCAVPILAGFTLNEMSSAGSLVSTAVSGKGLGEHALDLVTGEDCRVAEGLMRSDRDICEPRGSAATADDFHGLAGLASGPRSKHVAGESANGPIAAAMADHGAPAKAKAAPPLVAARPAPAAPPALVATRPAPVAPPKGLPPV